eukprot:TRINITY_DN1173_c0_g1_i4.p1 TRINITY_DN1173_c0_g1~~TRINITY_DN1173_c0_g1_i4.p1  ORF type:complete len:262 (+),score=59.51 TRINITY_DN1173_c0_g1_i4:92-877(+)
MLFDVAVAVFTVLAIIAVVKIVNFFTFYSHIPGIGFISTFWHIHRFNEYFAEQNLKHPRRPKVFFYDALALRVVMATHPDTARLVLTNPALFPKAVASGAPPIMNLMNNSLILNNGDSWRRVRHVLNPHFHICNLRKLSRVFADKIAILVDSWTRQCGTDSELRLDVVPWLTRLSLDIVGKTSLGHEYNSLAKGRQDSPEVVGFNTLIENCLSLSRAPLLVSCWIPSRVTKSVYDAADRMDKLFEEILEAKLATVPRRPAE